MNKLQTPDLLKSKRFWTFAIMTLLIVLNDLTSLSLSETEMEQIVAASLLLIGVYGIQDVATAVKTGTTKYQNPKGGLTRG